MAARATHLYTVHETKQHGLGNIVFTLSNATFFPIAFLGDWKSSLLQTKDYALLYEREECENDLHSKTP